MSESSETMIQETPLGKTMNNAPGMKGKKPVALIIVLLCLILIIAAGAVSSSMHHTARIYGEQEWYNIRMTVDQELEGAILVKIVNNSSEKMNFGWVDSATAILRTNKGSYVQKLKRTIPSRTTGNVLSVFPKAEGVPEYISFESVGAGLGANSSVQIDISVHGEGDTSIRPMNLFETTWAYIRWAYYWMISVSDTQGTFLRIFVALISITVLVHLFSLLAPRKSIRAKLVKKYIEETTHYQNGACTGTTYTYYAVFLTEKGRNKKVDVRSRKNYDKFHSAGWGLLTMKGVLFVSFEYLPSAGRVESTQQEESSEISIRDDVPIKTHRILPWILGTLSLILIAAIVYLYLNPGSMQSITSWVNQAFVQKASDTREMPRSNIKVNDQTATEIASSLSQKEDDSAGHNDMIAQPVEYSEQSFRVNRDNGLTLRAKADMKSKTITRVKNNDIVIAIDDDIVVNGNNHWRQVKTQSGDTGWIICDFLDPVVSNASSREQESTVSAQDIIQEGFASYAGMKFTIKRTGASTGILIIDSNTSGTWKFAPWVGHSSTVTLVRTDKSKAHAEISTSNMFYEYQTMNFDKGKTFTFDLSFDDQSTEKWKSVTISIASFLKTHNVEIKLK